MSKERQKDLEMQRLSQLILIAEKSYETGILEGQISGKEFVVLTREPAQVIVQWSQGLSRHVDFVVSYMEEDKVKHSILRRINNEEIEIIDPGISRISTISMDQFYPGWEATDNRLMMIRKD